MPHDAGHKSWWRRLAHPLTIGRTVLIAAGVILLINLVGLFLALNERGRADIAAVREDAVWAAYQLDRETSRLHDELQVDEVQAGWADQVSKRYDILYSRTGLLTQGQFRQRFGGDAEFQRQIETVIAAIMALAPRFDAIAAGEVPDRATRRQLAADVQKIEDLTGGFVVAVNSRHYDTKVAERAEVLGHYNEIAWNASGIALVFVLFMGLLGFQLRHIRRLGNSYRRAADEARAANNAKSAFLATMSHEIRTPLNGVLGMADLLDDDALSPSQRNKVAIIRQSGDALLDVINDILDFSKLESGAIELDMTSFPLADAIGAVSDLMRPRARAKGVELHSVFPDVNVTTDAGRLRQILINLVGNALKFTEAGSVHVQASIESDRTRGTLLRIEVADTGIGMSPETLAGLFNEFVQGDRSINRRFGGTGLGLAICKRLATALGGSISVESHEAIGTTFTLELPCKVDAVVHPESAPIASPTQRHGRVLLVEDNPINRQVAESLLSRIGMTVSNAANGQEALDALRVRTFDLVFMDMQMPVMDGLTATRQVRAEGIHTHIIGLTANAFASDREACLAAGMDDFITKPVTRAKLEAAIDLALLDGSDTSIQPAAPAAEDDMLDHEQQQALIDELGQEQFDELLEHFRADAIALLAPATGNGLQPDAAQQLHTLKGMARTLGMRRIGDLAATAELEIRAGKAPDLDEIRRLVAGLAEHRAAA
jgi:signal transduction histidine kinase/CheY-like chemotaxis protein/HPt (histidine-containing phosphotransfer) domain-containing protein